MSRPGAVGAPATKAARQATIIAILAETGKPVRSQEQLVDRLAEQGVFVTQATLSRDLDEIGAVRLRGPDGALVYALPADHPAGLEPPPPATTAFARVAADLLLSAEASGNLVVLKTPPGAAQLMASMIDRSGMTAVLGTVAGDDTVLVVARDPAGGDNLAATFLQLAERRVKTARGGHAQAD